MSFQLVDRIHQLTPGRHARGTVLVPGGLSEFPLSLAVEAVGQLATYVAMHGVGFAKRPVAATAGQVIARREIRPADVLELEVVLGAVRPHAIRYDGFARVHGETAVELRRCMGAMLPMEEFDDPRRVEAEFQRLCDEGIPHRTFPDRAEFAPKVVLDEVDPRGRLQATLTAPADAPFYADHFPLRPVYPATLLLDAKIAIAQRLLAHGRPPGAPPLRVRVVRDVRVRAFTPPGGRVDVVVEAVGTGSTGNDHEVGAGPTGSDHEVRMTAFADDTRVSAATAIFADDTGFSEKSPGDARPPEPGVSPRHRRPPS